MERPAKRQRPHDTLGDEMKGYEAATCSSIVDTSNPVVVRLDGHCFHTLTRGFQRPYDMRIHNAMVATATDLLERFSAVTAYTESDEISLLFPPSTGEMMIIPFGGRVQKIASVCAGYASARFNLHLAAQKFDETDENEAVLSARVNKCEAHFDARVFSLPDQGKLVDYVRWRALMDCRRNSISMLAQANFPPERLHGVSANSVLRMLHEEKGMAWEEEPQFFRFGCFIKKEQYQKPAYNPMTQQEVVATRTRSASRSFEFRPEEASAFLLARFWPGPGPGPGL